MGSFFFPLCFSQMEPKRLKKQLPKMLKLLKPDDRILIVGTTKRPFDAELQPFCKAYQKIILVPRPDYASRYGKYPLAPSRVQPVRLDHPCWPCCRVGPGGWPSSPRSIRRGREAKCARVSQTLSYKRKYQVRRAKRTPLFCC